MDKLIDFLTSIGLQVPIMSLVIVILTGLIKIPIKHLADKTHSPKKITRFITLLPVVLGFGLTVLVMFLCNGIVNFTDAFYNIWLSSVSLSLAVYAVWEKFVPSEKKLLSDAEIKANQELVDELKDKLINNHITELTEANDNIVQAVEQPESVETTTHRKIILTNHKNN